MESALTLTERGVAAMSGKVRWNGKVGDSVDAFPEGLPLQYATPTRAGLTAGFGMGPGGPRRYGRRTTSPVPGKAGSTHYALVLRLRASRALASSRRYDLHMQPD